MGLTQEQYDKLKERYPDFECFNNPNCGHAKNFDGIHLQNLKEVYQQVFQHALNTSCAQCLKSALTRLWPHLKDYHEKTISETKTEA